MEETIPLKKEEQSKQEESNNTEELSTLPHNSFEQEAENTAGILAGILHRRFLPIQIPQIGRSLKLRDVFTLSGALNANSTVVTVTADGSSGNETDLKSFRILKDEWHVGMVIRITANGTITDDGTRTCTFRVGSGLAPTTEWNSMTSTAATVTDAPWNLIWTGIVTTIGSSGTLEAQMQGKINNVNKDDPNTATVTINTTGTITVALTADWSASNANNNVKIRQWIFEILY